MKKISVLFLAVSFLASAAIAQDKKSVAVQAVSKTQQTAVAVEQPNALPHKKAVSLRGEQNKLQAEPVKAAKAEIPSQTVVEQKASEIKK